MSASDSGGLAPERLSCPPRIVTATYSGVRPHQSQVCGLAPRSSR